MATIVHSWIPRAQAGENWIDTRHERLGLVETAGNLKKSREGLYCVVESASLSAAHMGVRKSLVISPLVSGPGKFGLFKGNTTKNFHWLRFRATVTCAQAEASDEPTCSSVGSEDSSKFVVHSWVFAGGARSPLSHEEELSYSADIQDLLHLESTRKQLHEGLGRVPSDKEWANKLNISVARLYARIGRGRSARRKMVSANLPLVSSIAEQFQNRGLTHQELCQAGLVGLLKSTERYDSSRNTKFSSYAYFWIFERIGAAVKDVKHVFRVANGVYRTASVLLKSRDEFRDSYQREPTVAELSKASNVSERRIREVFRIMEPAKSINSVDVRSGRASREISHPSSCDIPWFVIGENELKIEVGKALETLYDREKLVLRMRFGLDGDQPKTRTQVAAALSLHPGTVRLAEIKALEKLRTGCSENGLQQYLSRNLWEH